RRSPLLGCAAMDATPELGPPYPHRRKANQTARHTPASLRSTLLALSNQESHSHTIRQQLFQQPASRYRQGARILWRGQRSRSDRGGSGLCLAEMPDSSRDDTQRAHAVFAAIGTRAFADRRAIGWDSTRSHELVAMKVELKLPRYGTNMVEATIV